MSRRVSWVIVAAVLLSFVAALSWLFHLRLSGGDVFPRYSTLRADPLGARAFYEALIELPGLQVERWMKPLPTLPVDPPRTLIFPGMIRRAWDQLAEQDAQAIDAAAAAGSRVVIAFSAELEPEQTDTPSDRERERRRRFEKENEKKLARQPARLKPSDWKARWNIELKRRLILDQERGALRSQDAPAGLPGAVPWKSDLYLDFPHESGWTVLYSRGHSPVVVERLRGRGSIVLATDSFFLSNEALNGQRFTGLLSWLVGTNSRIVFTETHLGVSEEVGIASLARHYGLGDAFFVLLLFAALWIWKRMVVFVPAPTEVDRLSLNYEQTAGLEAVLRRAIPPKELITTCVKEWSESARTSDAERVRRALDQLPEKISASEAYNAAVNALKKRSPL